MDIEKLKTYFSYDPTTGHFSRRGKRADRIGSGGYRVICFRGQKIKAHRLALAFTLGRWPIEVDHINRQPDDNRLVNLREVTRSQNMHNLQKEGGVSHSSRNHPRPWRAYVYKNYKFVHVGYFATFEAAKAAREQAKQELIKW